MLPQRELHDETALVRRPTPRILPDWAAMLAIGVVAGLVLVGRFQPGKHAAATAHGPRTSEAAILRDEPVPGYSPVPRQSWKDRLKRLCGNISEHRVMALAAGMTFYSLLAIFPALAALVSIYSLFADPSTIADHLNSLSGLLPGGAIDIARDQLSRVAAKGRQTLGWTFLIGLAISLWSANAAMKSLFDTLNVIHGEREKRGFVRLNVLSLALTLAAIVFGLFAIATIVVLPVALHYVGLSDRTDLLLRAGRWPGLFIALALSLSVIYRYGPSRTSARWRWISWGSVLAALLWLAASGLFSWYAANFGTYNRTYGSLGAAVGFMTWLWISAIAVLIGAEIEAEMEQRNPRRPN